MIDVRSMMRRAAQFNSERVAVVAGDRRLTYAEAWSRGLRLTNALLCGMLAITRFPVFADGHHGIEAVLPDGSTYRIGDGAPTVRVTGELGEVALWATGRGSAAQVDVEGDVPEAALRV